MPINIRTLEEERRRKAAEDAAAEAVRNDAISQLRGGAFTQPRAGAYQIAAASVSDAPARRLNNIESGNLRYGTPSERLPNNVQCQAEAARQIYAQRAAEAEAEEERRRQEEALRQREAEELRRKAAEEPAGGDVMTDAIHRLAGRTYTSSSPNRMTGGRDELNALVTPYDRDLRYGTASENVPNNTQRQGEAARQHYATDENYLRQRQAQEDLRTKPAQGLAYGAGLAGQGAMERGRTVGEAIEHHEAAPQIEQQNQADAELAKRNIERLLNGRSEMELSEDEKAELRYLRGQAGLYEQQYESWREYTGADEKEKTFAEAMDADPQLRSDYALTQGSQYSKWNPNEYDDEGWAEQENLMIASANYLASQGQWSASADRALREALDGMEYRRKAQAHPTEAIAEIDRLIAEYQRIAGRPEFVGNDRIQKQLAKNIADLKGQRALLRYKQQVEAEPDADALALRGEKIAEERATGSFSYGAPLIFKTDENGKLTNEVDAEHQAAYQTWFEGLNRNTNYYLMNERERRTYHVLLALDEQNGTKEADAFYEALLPYLNERATNVRAEDTAEYTRKHPGMANVEAGIMELGKPLESLFTIADAFDGQLDAYSPYHTPSDYQQTVNETTVQMIRDRHPDDPAAAERWTKLYQLGTNIGYNLIRNAGGRMMGFGPGTQTAMMAFGTLGGETEEWLRSDAGTGEALAMAGFSAFAEWIGEKLPTEDWFKGITGKGLDAIKGAGGHVNVLKLFGVALANSIKEAPGEMLTEILQIGQQYFASEEVYTRMAMMVDELVKLGGMTEAQAKQYIMEAQLAQILEAGYMAVGSGFVTNMYTNSYAAIKDSILTRHSQKTGQKSSDNQADAEGNSTAPAQAVDAEGHAVDPSKVMDEAMEGSVQDDAVNQLLGVQPQTQAADRAENEDLGVAEQAAAERPKNPEPFNPGQDITPENRAEEVAALRNRSTTKEQAQAAGLDTDTYDRIVAMNPGRSRRLNVRDGFIPNLIAMQGEAYNRFMSVAADNPDGAVNMMFARMENVLDRSDDIESLNRNLQAAGFDAAAPGTEDAYLYAAEELHEAKTEDQVRVDAIEAMTGAPQTQAADRAENEDLGLAQPAQQPAAERPKNTEPEHVGEDITPESRAEEVLALRNGQAVRPPTQAADRADNEDLGVAQPSQQPAAERPKNTEPYHPGEESTPENRAGEVAALRKPAVTVTTDRDGTDHILDADGNETEPDPESTDGKLLSAGEGMDADAKNDMLAGYDEGGDTDEATYAEGYRQVYDAAAEGKEAVNSPYTEALTPQQRARAERMGKLKAQAQQRQDDITTRQIAAQEGYQAHKQGPGVSFEHVTKPLTSGQRAQLKVLQGISERFRRIFGTAPTFHIYDSMGDANGRYHRGTLDIDIALDAEGGMLLRTAGHETYHLMKDQSQADADALRKFVLDKLASMAGYDLEARRNQYRARYAQAQNADIDDEIVADSLFDVLSREDNISELANGNQPLANKLISFIGKVRDAVRSTLRAMTRGGMYAEMRALIDEENFLEELHTRWQKGMANALRNAADRQQTQYNATNAARQNSDVQAYIDAVNAADTQEERRRALDRLLDRLLEKTQGRLLDQNPDSAERVEDLFRDALIASALPDAAHINTLLRDRGLLEAAQSDFAALKFAGRELAAMEQRTAEQAESVANRAENGANRAENVAAGKNDFRSDDDVEYSFIEKDDETGRSIYMSNFAEGENGRFKRAYAIRLIQKIFSRKPINLRIKNDDGTLRIVQAVFDPEYDPSAGNHSSTGKIAYGLRRGNNKERRIALNLVDDYLILADEALLNDIAPNRKDSRHEEAKQWLYFIDDIYYMEQGSDEMTPYRITFVVEEKTDGNFIYSIEAKEDTQAQKKKAVSREMSSRPGSLHKVGNEQQLSANIVNGSGKNVNNKKSKVTLQKKVGYAPGVPQYGKRNGINNENYYMGTRATFTPTSRPDSAPDHVSDSGSEYWYSESGLIRGSDHWGTLASCDWHMKGDTHISSKDDRHGKRYGKVTWDDIKAKDNRVTIYSDGLPDYDGISSDGKKYKTFRVTPAMMKNARVYAFGESAAYDANAFTSIDLPDSKNVSFSVREDRDYMSAVEAGDMDTAQQMVEEAAETALPDSAIRDEDRNLRMVYHGTSENFTVFDVSKGRANMDIQGSFFSPWEIDAGGYGENVGRYYLNITNPAPEQTAYAALRRFQGQNGAGIKAREYLISQGYDGVNNEDEEYIAFYPNQIKSADPVTYDDKGNVIPLSERFNEENDDIRWSQREDLDADAPVLTAATDEDRAYAGELVQRLYDLTQQTGALPAGAWKGARITALARELKERFNIGLSEQTIKNRLRPLFQALDKGGLDVSEAMRYATEAARGLLGKDTVQLTETANNLLSWAKGQILYLTEDDLQNMMVRNEKYNRGRTKEQGRWRLSNEELAAVRAAFRRFGVRITTKPATGTITLDSQWADLGRMTSWQYFDEETNRGDQLSALQRALELASEDRADKWESEYTVSKEQQAQQLALDLFWQYFNAPEAMANSHNEADKVRQQALERFDALKTELKQTEQELKDAYRDRIRLEIDNRHEADARRGQRYLLDRTVNRLTRALLNPDNKKHIPEEFRLGVAKALQQVYGRMEDFLGMTPFTQFSDQLQKAPSVRTINLQTLSNLINQTVRNMSETMIIDEDMVEDLNELSKVADGKAIGDMTSDELKQLNSVLNAISYMCESADKARSEAFQRRITETGFRMMQKLGKFDDKKLARGLKRQITSFLGSTMQDPTRYFQMLERYMGEDARDMWKALREDGLNTMIRLTEEMKKRFNDALKGYNYKEWTGKDARSQTFKVTGGTVTLTDAQIMYLYLMNQREQGRKHLYSPFGGIAQPLTESKNGVTRSSRPVQVTEEDVQKITSTLSAEQRRCAETLRELISVCSDWGNEVSMALFGYKKFTEDKYFPIKTFRGDAGTKGTEQGDKDHISLYAMLNQGFTKNLERVATNGLSMEDIFDVAADHAVGMINYRAWSLPMTDITRLINVNLTDAETGITTNSLGAEMDRVLGTDAKRYLVRLLKNINGLTTDEVESKAKLFSTFFRRYKGAAVAFNMSTVLKQGLSIVRAFDVIPAHYFVTGKQLSERFGKDQGQEKRRIDRLMEKYAPIYAWKQDGRFTMDTGKDLKQALLPELAKWPDKITEFGMKWAGAMDNMTWHSLWIASERMVEDRRSDLTPGTEAFYEEVGRVFSDCIDKTQVVDSILHRTEIMRSNSMYVKMGTSFMGEPLKTYNQFLDKWMAWRQNPNTRTMRAMVKTSGVLLASAVLQAFISSLIRGLRKWDDEKTLGERIQGNLFGEYEDKDGWNKGVELLFGNGLAEELNILNYIPFARDIGDILQGYDVTRDDMTVLSNVIQAAQRVAENSGKGSDLKNAADLATALSDMLGIPASNALKEVQYIWNIANRTLEAGGADTLYSQYTLRRYQQGLKKDTNFTSYARFANKAEDKGNEGMVEMIKKDMIENMGKEEKEVLDKMASLRLGDLIGSSKLETAYEELAVAIEGNDKEMIESLTKALTTKGKTKEDIQDGIKGYLKTEDRIIEAARKRIAGDISGHAAIRKEYRNKGFDDATVAAAINAAANKILTDKNGKQTNTYQTGLGEDTVRATTGYQYADLYTAIDTGSNWISTILSDLRQQGKTDKTIKSQLSSYFKPIYKELMHGTTTERNQAAALKKRLMDMKVGYTDKDFENWLKSK